MLLYSSMVNLMMIPAIQFCLNKKTLKDRIENLTGWDKEADDILREICPNGYHIDISDTPDYRWIEGVFWDRKNNFQRLEGFDFTSQYSKLRAFKDALLWLLDKSGIEDDFKVGDYVVALDCNYFKNLFSENQSGNVFKIHKCTREFIWFDKNHPNANCYKRDVRKATEKEIEAYLNKHKLKQEIAEMKEKLAELEKKL